MFCDPQTLGHRHQEASPIDLAQRLVGQHRRMLDSVTTVRGYNNLPTCPDSAMGAAGETMNQMAERFSALLTNQQHRCDETQQRFKEVEEDIGRRLQDVSNRADTRQTSLEARVVACEEWCNNDSFALDTAKVLREARALVAGVIVKAETQWSVQRSELRSTQMELTQQVDQLVEQNRHQAIKWQQLDQTVQDHARTIRHTQDELGRLVSNKERPTWFEDIEASVGKLEHRICEHETCVEMQMRRFNTDLDAVKLRLGGLVDEMRVDLDHRFEHDAWQLAASVPAQTGNERNSRIDELESRIAAIRIHVDCHDGRLENLGERVEAACMKSIEGARQEILQQCDLIMSGVEGQIKVLREHIHGLSDLVQELSFQQLGDPFLQEEYSSPLRQLESRSIRSARCTEDTPRSTATFEDSFK